MVSKAPGALRQACSSLGHTRAAVKSLAMVNQASGALRQACSSLDHTRTDHCYDGEDADLDNENSG